MNAFILLLLHFSFSSVSLVSVFLMNLGPVECWNTLTSLTPFHSVVVSGRPSASFLFEEDWAERASGVSERIKSYLSKNTCPFTALEAHIHTDTQTCNRSLGYRSGLWSQASDCCSICWGMLIHVIMTWGAEANWYELNCRWNCG